MKVSGRNLKRRLYGRVSEFRNRLSRARYFRGHGVHSPYIYSIVRKVFMRRTLLPGDRALFTALLARGIPAQRAVQLQNLCIHCGYETFGLNCVQGQFCVVTPDLSTEQMLTLVQQASQTGRTVAILAPGDGNKRLAACRTIVASHGCTTVDNRAYLLIFNNHLPKQHFQL